MPDWQTVGERVLPYIEKAYLTNYSRRCRRSAVQEERSGY
jgi:hypothetical protein